MRFFHLKEQAVGFKPTACSFKTNGVFLGEEHPLIFQNYFSIMIFLCGRFIIFVFLTP